MAVLLFYFSRSLLLTVWDLFILVCPKIKTDHYGSQSTVKGHGP